MTKIKSETKYVQAKKTATKQNQNPTRIHLVV